ncbi:DUF6177 family protein [Streptomyces sp. Tue6028]|uniref:DUF6177 family protein n=1 Tax=Streptomyces sp. Tue6028 TaxID=2036037 RepID=UPI0015C81E5C|nr:DUF6177 family protein [Streptomyces sp. Tue6028]
MTKDVIALTEKMPDPVTVLAGLYAGGPDLRINTLADGAVTQLCTPGGLPLVSVEVPLLLQVPGEVSRLLGPRTQAPDTPLWWTEARATTALVEAERLAGSFAGRLATVLGGTVWPPEAAHTDVVPLSTQTTTAPAPGTTTPPAADILTDRAAIVIQDRPLIPMTSWLSDTLSTAITSGRALQIVTSPHTRLTLPTRNALGGYPHRWVVQHPDSGYYDGLSGAELHWADGAFTPTKDTDGKPRLAEAFHPPGNLPVAQGERQLLLTLRTLHPATEDLLLGDALETAWHHLTGAPPAGWSTAEPVNLPWNKRQLTDLARARAQQSAPTWLIAIGAPEHPTIATTRITHTPAGIEEHTTLALGYGPDETVPLDSLPDLAETLATQHGLTSLLTTLRTARRDLTIPPRLEPPPIPVSFTLGPDSVRDIGLTHAENPTLDVTPIRLGPTARPALRYPLGDGTDPDAWTRLQQLNQHLGRRPGRSAN